MAVTQLARTVLLLIENDEAWQALDSGLLHSFEAAFEHCIVASWLPLKPRQDYTKPLITLNSHLLPEWPLDAVITLGKVTESGLQVFSLRFNTHLVDMTEVADDFAGFVQRVNRTVVKRLHDASLDVNDDAPRERVKPGLRNVVMFWKQNDSGMFGRRCEKLAQYLSTRKDVQQVLLIDAMLDESRLLKWRDAPAGSLDARLYARVIARALSGEQLDALGKLQSIVFVAGRYYTNVKTYLGFLQRRFAAQHIEPAQALFMLYPKLPFARAILRYFVPGQVVTDVVDDQRTWPGLNVDDRMQLTMHYRDLISRSDHTLTNCLPLKVAMSAFSTNVKVIANACDVSPVGEETAANREWLQCISAHRRLGGPVLGYVGNLESKVDIVLLKTLADARPDALILLVGSTHASSPDLSSLTGCANVYLTGVLEYPDVGAVISAFDIALVPHHINAMTKAMNPLKVLSYLSWHKPVVATAVANLADCPYVFIEPGHSQFIERVNLLLTQLDSLQPEVFNDYCRGHSWQALFQPFFDYVLQEEPARAALTIGQ